MLLLRESSTAGGITVAACLTAGLLGILTGRLLLEAGS